MKAINLVMSIYSLINISIIVIIFFAKKRIKSFETNTYAGIIVVNLLNCIFEILSFVALNTLGHNNPIYLTLMKIILCIYLAWTTIFTLYFVQISVGQEKKYNIRKIIKYAAIIFSIMALVAIIAPIVYIENNGLYIPGGIGTMLVYGYSGICDIAMLYLFVRYGRKKLNKKYIPMLLLLGLSVIVMIFQMANPEYFLITPLLVYISIVMYFTIENPDLKMIEQLDAARNQADKANRAKTDFLSSMSHEIRTPLNAIVGFSDYIMSADTLEEAKENAKDIVNASNTLLEIVNGILDISKIEAGKLEITNSKYNAKQTFEALAKLITPKMREKGLDFTYYIAPDLPDTLFGDHANLKKIITNLLSNAYKYTEKGSVRYEVNCINSNNITKLIITVEDTGRGIKQENIDKLFTKFERIDEDRNTTIEGTGLGLAITKQLIELMGGKILVHTVYGEGSKFTVVLNQQIEKTEIVEEPIEIKTTLDLKDKKILLVDDNSLNIKVANKILERFNANNITSLDNGFDCLDLIQSGAVFDIILMDDMMPKMSGVETFKKLKEIEGFNQPVVILTANAITGMKEKYLKEGFEDYLAKPIEKDELIRVCNTIFQKYQKNQPEPPEEDNTVPKVAPIEEIKTVETIEFIEPIQTVEEVEELEIIGEEEPTISNKESYLKENGVELDKALELLGDIEMYNMTISDFLTEVEEKWNNINNYKNNLDMENYAIEVHSLKSDAKYLGFTSLAEISYEHELKSKENDNNYVQEHFSELETEYNKALAIAKTYNNM